MANYVFNDTTGAQDGLIQECEDITNLGAGNISGNTARMKTFTRRLNQAKDRFITIAMKFDALWKFDDRRYADSDLNLPIATTNLVSGTKDYLFDSTFLTIEQVFVKDSSGNWHELDQQDDKTAPDAYIGTATGLPTTYEFVGNSLILDITPDYNSTGGLKVVTRRKLTNFSYGDGAVPISAPEIFFKYLANYASFPYLIEKGLKHAPLVKQMIQEDELIHIPAFISNRAKPKRAGLRTSNLSADSNR